MPGLEFRGPPLREWDRCSDTHATELSFPTVETDSFVLLSAVQNTTRTRQLSVITASDNSKCKNSEDSRTGQRAENLNIRIISVTYELTEEHSIFLQSKNTSQNFITLKQVHDRVVCYKKLQFNSPHTEAIDSL
jgi:hypothetical protein